MNLAGIIKRIEELTKSADFYQRVSDTMLVIATSVQQLEQRVSEQFTAAAQLERIRTDVYERIGTDPHYTLGQAQVDLQQILDDEE